jgi:hypothetical protein
VTPSINRYLGAVDSHAGEITRSFRPFRNVQLFHWVGETAAKRSVGVLLALYAFATDWVTGWHGMNFVLQGILDWPAHLATAVVILGALVRVRRGVPDQRFGWTMLACSVLIDIDHIPEEFGFDVLTYGTPRPYTHAIWLVITLTFAWAIARHLAIRYERDRPATIELVLAGAAWGVAAHFVRDIATAPMSFWWPVTKIAVEVPYWWYVMALAIVIAIGPVPRLPRKADTGPRYRAQAGARLAANDRYRVSMTEATRLRYRLSRAAGGRDWLPSAPTAWCAVRCT